MNSDLPIMDLQDWMDEKGFSIRELAKAADVSVSTIESIIRGHKYETPHIPIDTRPPTMKKMADALKVEMRQVKQFAEILDRRRGKENRQMMGIRQPLAV